MCMMIPYQIGHRQRKRKNRTIPGNRGHGSRNFTVVMQNLQNASLDVYSQNIHLDQTLVNLSVCNLLNVNFLKKKNPVVHIQERDLV